MVNPMPHFWLPILTLNQTSCIKGSIRVRSIINHSLQTTLFMKNLGLIMLVFLGTVFSAQAQKYFTRDGSINFIASTPMETIDATSKGTTAVTRGITPAGGSNGPRKKPLFWTARYCIGPSAGLDYGGSRRSDAVPETGLHDGVSTL